MSEIPDEPHPPDGPTTTWDWVVGFGWVERECTPAELALRYPVLEVVHTPRPADTATSTWESHVEDVAGVPTLVWTERLWTPEELAEQAHNAERETARAEVRAIIVALVAEKDRAQAVIDNPDATRNEKDLGRACKRIADAAISLARYVG